MDSESVITNKLVAFMTEFRSFKFVKIVFIDFNKIGTDDAVKYATFYCTSKAETTINVSGIDTVFQSIYTTIISNIQKYIGKALAGLLIQ